MQRRIADIEILRGIAISLVVFQNLKTVLFEDQNRWLNWLLSFFDFSVGLDIFFAITGFVVALSFMSGLTGEEKGRQPFAEVISFWVRQVWRLWPSAWLWLGVILLAATVANRSGQFGSIRANAEATVVALLQVANFRFFASRIEHFEYGASFYYWPLSQQAQFYILLPLLIILLRRRVVALLVAVIVIRAMLALIYPELQSLVLVMLARSDAMLLGVLLAVWSITPSHRLFEPFIFQHRLARWILLPLLFICLSALACNQLHIAPDPLRFIIIGGFATIPVFIASYDKGFFCATGVLHKLLLWLGSRSYGLYLIHVPIFLLSKELWFESSMMKGLFHAPFSPHHVFATLLLTLALSELNYRLVEAPLRRHGIDVAKKIQMRRSAELSAV